MTWRERGDRFSADFERRPIRTGWKVFLVFLALSLIVGLVLLIVGLAGGWANKGAEIVSASNVEKQYAVIIDDWQALTVTASNACGAQRAATDENSPTLVESPELAYAATYRNVVADYNAAFANVFKAGLVGPPGYPREIPDELRATGAETDFCTLSEQLAELRAQSQ